MKVILIVITLLIMAINLHHLRSALVSKWPAKKDTYYNSVNVDIQTSPVPGILIRLY